MKIAIIGAGVAGLSAAQELKQAGHQVRLFDKGRGAGGRLSTRRAQTPAGELRFDHGAQFFTARDDGFRALIQDFEVQGYVASWTPRRARLSKQAGDWRADTIEADPADQWYVGSPAMNALVKAMAEGHEIGWNMRATQLERRPGGNYIQFEGGDLAGPFDAVILAVPAEQAGTLLAVHSPALAKEASEVVTAPCLAAMLAFEQRVSLGWDVAEIEGAPISLAVRNSSKPGRDKGETFVLHASPAWTRANLDMDSEDVAATLAGLFGEMTGAPQPVFASAHRWLYARTETAAGSPFGWDDQSRIGVIGDWRIAPRVEAAWQSGHALAVFLGD